jgi:hypothetical protein
MIFIDGNYVKNLLKISTLFSVIFCDYLYLQYI